MSSQTLKKKWKRWKINDEDLQLLKYAYCQNTHPDRKAIENIRTQMSDVNTTFRNIKVWFQNQRQRRKDDDMTGQVEAVPSTSQLFDRE